MIYRSIVESRKDTCTCARARTHTYIYLLSGQFENDGCAHTRGRYEHVRATVRNKVHDRCSITRDVMRAQRWARQTAVAGKRDARINSLLLPPLLLLLLAAAAAAVRQRSGELRSCVGARHVSPPRYTHVYARTNCTYRINIPHACTAVARWSASPPPVITVNPE